MKVYGASADDVNTVIRDVSRDLYDDNLIVKSCEDRGNSRGPRAIFTLQVLDSHAGRPGAIGVPGRTGNGPHGMKRRSNSACWHAHWDVIEELLRRYPDARVTSGFRLRDVAVQYTAATFRETALATAHLNVHTWAGPTTMPECCECDHSRYTDEPPTVDTELSRPAYRADREPTVPSWMPGSAARATYRPGEATAYLDAGRDTLGYQPWDGRLPATVGYGASAASIEPHGVYPLDVVKPAAPWTPRVKPGSATVGDTLDEIDKHLSEA